MRAVVTVIDQADHALRVVVPVMLTDRGWVHVCDLEPAEAFDLAPELTDDDVATLLTFARAAVRARRGVDAFRRRGGRRAA